MLRDGKDVPSPDGRYAYRDYVIESGKELQELNKVLPDTAEIPTSHELYVETRVEERNGQRLTIKRVGVREKAATEPGRPAEADNLNSLDDAALEVEAAKLGVANYPRNASRAKRVAVIREARAKAAHAE